MADITLPKSFEETIDFLYEVQNMADATEKAQVLWPAYDGLVSAIRLLEKAEAFHLTCDECNGEDIPELCEKCFPLYDDARQARRQALAAVGSVGTKP